MCMTVYHNNSWGKSRKVLQLLRDNNINFTVIEYLKEPISYNELHNICQILAITPIELVRTNDKYFKALNVNINSMNNDEILELLVNHPKILERPIIVKNNDAVIGRPPENVEKLF